MLPVLFDEASRTALYPFTHTRATADIRCGILTARERWSLLLGASQTATRTAGYLQSIYTQPDAAEALLINGSIIATPAIAAAVQALSHVEALYSGEILIAARPQTGLPDWESIPTIAAGMQRKSYEGEVLRITRPWDIFSLNDRAIRQDYALLTQGRTSAPVPPDVTLRGSELFIEEGAIIGPGSIINAATGPVYIGKGSEVMEGCIIRGPFALCEGATLKMGAKIYSATTIGPGCKVGGEVSNAVFFANSNKGHDGFLGNAVIGEWCNLGADTNCSNLKNNYDAVKVWDEAAQKSVATGLTFCGLLMGDHSKCGINTMFNTGTVAGVSCNIWGGGFPEKFLPSFSWGGPEGMSTYKFERAMETAERMMARRGKSLGEAERAMLRHVFESTAASRSLIFKD